MYAYDAEWRLSIDLEKISIDGIMVKRLPRNKSITYTGLRLIKYLVHVDNKTCVVTFWTIGTLRQVDMSRYKPRGHAAGSMQ